MSSNALVNKQRLSRLRLNGSFSFPPLVADPASAVGGDVYFNSITKKLRLYDGDAWVDIGGSSTPNTGIDSADIVFSLNPRVTLANQVDHITYETCGVQHSSRSLA